MGDKLDVTLRQEHRAGEKPFIDCAGQTISIIDIATGEEIQAQIFIVALGCSNYTLAEASLAQDLPSWIRSHVHSFEFFGGVPEILVPDNLKSGVTHACLYEPDINARPGHAEDKTKVESAVLIAERWILAALRNHSFFSLAELNHAIAQKLQGLNSRPHPEQGFRSCLGIMRIGNTTPGIALRPRARALTIKAYSCKSVESILKNGLDQLPLPLKAAEHPQP